MSNYSVVSAKHASLVANVIDNVTLARQGNQLIVVNRGSADIFFTINGSNPTVSGDNNYIVPASNTTVVGIDRSGTIVVSLVSSSTPAYSVMVA